MFSGHAVRMSDGNLCGVTLTPGTCCHVTELTSMETEAGVVERDADDEQECDVTVAKETELVVKTVHAGRAHAEPRQ